jgi:hypothetical protein
MLPAGYRVRSTPVLGGLHREYYLEKEAAWRRTEFLRRTGDVDLLHRHHRLEGTLCLTATSRKGLG